MTNWDIENMEPELTEREKALRDRFVAEYLVDRNEVAAAIRIGYGASFAKEYAVKFMGEPYTLNKIKELKAEQLTRTEEEIDDIIFQGLLERAQNPYGSDASRVAAFTALAKLRGMEKPTKTENVNINTDKKSVVTFYLPSNGRDAAHGS